MFFKKLELFGFKSFADKVELHFEPGVTAIVGPNGCGKSNVSDSIRWVLGESSAKAVRGSKMEDVIFNGTSNRAPINVAEVNLTLSNETRLFPVDYDEVTITRRIYRSGESEYLLNKTKVRLKDIQSLLMDTGLGTPSYSMIEQGRIDKILSSKPEDRRSIFEEASGVMKYKVKKKEAMNKLKLTQENLLRVEDVINELKRQMDTIQRQARKARKYKELFDELKRLDMTVSQIQFKELFVKKERLEQEIQEIETKNIEFQNQLAEYDVMFEEEKIVLKEIDEKIAKAQSEVLKITHMFTNNTNLMTVNEERIGEQNERIEYLKHEITSFARKLETLADSIKNSINEIECMQAEKQRNISIVSLLDAKLETIQTLHQLLQDKVVVEEKNRINFISVLSELKTKQMKLDAANDTFTQRNEQLTQDTQKIQSQMYDIENRLNDNKQKINSLPSEIKVYEEQQTAFQITHKDLENSQKTIEDNLMSLRQDESVKRSRLEFIQGLMQNYEGFSTGVKNLLMKIEEFPVTNFSVKGVIADIINVEDTYTKAIEVALGEDVQAIIVDSVQEAKAVVAYMRTNNLGHVRILTSESIHQYQQITCSHQNIIGMASNLVKVKEGFTDICSYLLNGIAIVKDLDEAYFVLSEVPQIHSVVTLNGDRIYQNGILSGGSFENEDTTTSILGRKTKALHLEKEIHSLTEKIQKELDHRDYVNNEIDNIKIKINDINDLIKNKEFALKSEYLLNEELVAKIQASQGYLHSISEEISNNNVKITANMKNKGMFELLVVDVQQREVLIQKNLEVLSTVTEELTQIRENFLMRKTKITSELDSIDTRVDEKKSYVETSQIERENELQNQEHRKKAIDECTYRIQTFQNEIVQIKKHNQELEVEKQQSEAEYVKYGEARADLALKVTELRQKINGITKEKETGQLRLRDIEKKSTEIDYKQKSIKDHILDIYQSDIDSLVLEIPEEFNVQESEEIMQDFKQRINQMGTVNLVAIEEEEESKQRYEFLSVQRDDLVKAKEDLLRAINKINRTSKELFKEAFEKIKVTFREYFKILFNGGEADLYLVDEHDVLESGIEVFVRPPGKQLQSISLLSGGERALTAVALLFSVFKVKPSPFCILDEIDAPLDESNVDRFTRMLREFVKVSQFIIITHNKKTISFADILYGITMQESGISKVVSVKFTKPKNHGEVSEKIIEELPEEIEVG